MRTFFYRYSPGNPPTPSVLLNLRHPIATRLTSDVPALVDSGADQTVLPMQIVRTLGLNQLDETLVKGFDGSIQVLATYPLSLCIRDMKPILVEVLASDRVEYAILGRDVLNRYRIIFDGPKQRLELTDNE